MIAASLASDHAVVIIDPLGSIATPALELIAPSRAHHLVYLRPADLSRPIGLNLLENVHPDQRAILADDVVSAAVHTWGPEAMGHRSQDILRNAVRALCDTAGSTIVGTIKLLLDENYRRRIVARVSDPLVRSFWRDEYDGTWSRDMRANSSAPLLNKLREALSAQHVRNILGQRSTFNLRKVLDDSGILIADLSGIGEANARLFGSILTSAIGAAAFQRVDTPRDRHRPAFVFIDEWPAVAGDGVKRITAMARNVSLGLTLCQQYLSQTTPDLRRAILGACANMIAFRAGAEDAPIVAEHLAVPPQLDYAGMGAREISGVERLVSLPKYRAFVRIPDDASLDGPVELDLLPPPLPIHPDPERLIRHSQRRFGRERTVVEEKIARFFGPQSSATAKARRRSRKALGL